LATTGIGKSAVDVQYSGAVSAGFSTDTGVNDPVVEGPAPSGPLPQYMALESVSTANE
jgi:hypothetical protein